MKVSIITHTLILPALILAGCAPCPRTVMQAPPIDFAPMSTFNWLDDPEDTQTFAQRIEIVKLAVNQQMQNKGFIMVSEDPDFRITQHISQHLVWNRDRKWRWDRHWEKDFTQSLHEAHLYEYPYEMEVLTLQFTDPRTNRTIWQRTESATVEPVITTESNRIRIDQTVEKILQNLKPKQKIDNIEQGEIPHLQR